MKNLCLSILLLSSSIYLNAQRNRHNIIFENKQSNLTETNKSLIRSKTNTLVKGEHITFYPITYDSSVNKLVYSRLAKEQAHLIAKYAESVGFKLAGIPVNFPSSYKGSSVAVNMYYNLDKENVTPAQQKALLHNPLRDQYPPKPSQFFTINPLEDTILVGKEGTILDLKAGSLMSKVPVKVELTEYYKQSDFIKNGLSTSSNNNLIESGGTIFMDVKEASNSNKQVNINPTKGVDVSFATTKKKDMQVFIKDPKRPTEINWVLPSQRTISSKRIELWQMTETTYGHDGKIVAEKKFNSKAEWAAYQEEQRIAKENKMLAAEKQRQEEEKLAAEKALKDKKAEENENLMRNKLSVYQLGFINCDRFYNDVTIPFNVNIDSKVEAEYYLVFEDIKSVIHAKNYDKQAKFGKLPTNAKATLLAVAFIGAQAYFYKTSLSISQSNTTKVNLKPVSDAFIDEQLKLLK